MGYSYSAPQWLLVFFLYCVLGWCFETTVVSVKQRHFVNRGFLRGPMLPIYGFGAVLLLHVSLPLYDRPAALFFASMAAATVFEYIVGVVMEKLFKVKYWDYSEHRFQFRGYICLQSSLCWGFLGLILARFIHRPVEWVIAALPFRALLAVDVLWSAAFLADVIVSVRAALDLARVLEELDRLREQGAELRQELSETALTRLTNLSYRVEEAAGELAERTRDAREEAQARTAAAAMRAADLRAARREITMIFQQFNLLMQRTCLRNIMFPMELAKVPKDKAEARARELLELVGLPDKADAYPAQLSGGQKQRIAIARALATDPKVLLCDEATSALDPNTTHAILQLIQKINRELGITVVIITHQMSVVEEVCNRVAILDNGTVVEEGEVQAIFSHPTSKAARRLVYPAGAPQAEVLPGHKLVRVAFGGTQTTDKPLVASLAIECGALVSIMAADTRIVNGQTLGSMLLALPDDDKAAAALEYIRNYPGITFEEVNG